MKKVISFILLIVLMLNITGCEYKFKKVSMIEKVKKVKIIRLEKTVYPDVLNYIGVLDTKDVKAYSFKSSGKVAEVYAKVGQKIKVGDKLASLDTKDLKFAVDVAKEQMESAQSQYKKALNGALIQDIDAVKLDVEKAKNAFEFTSKSYNEVKALYEKGAVSKKQLDEAEFNKDQIEKSLIQSKKILEKAENGTRKEDINAAKSRYETARVQYESSKSMLKESSIYSDIEGYVVNVFHKKGEIISAGYPIVAVRTDDQVVKVGLSQEDVKKVREGMDVKILIDNKEIKGKVSKINQMPDVKTRTYTVEADIIDTLIKKKFYLGSIAKVKFMLGEIEGIWMNVAYVMNDGEDYVYVVENNRIVRKNIYIKKLYNDKACVTGLTEDCLVVTNGMKNVKEGNKVIIEE